MQRLTTAACSSGVRRRAALAILIVAAMALYLVQVNSARADLGTNLQLYSSMSNVTAPSPPAYWEDVSGNDHVSLVNTPAYDGGEGRDKAVDFVGDNGANRILVKDGTVADLDPGLGDYSVSLWFNETQPETATTYLLSKGNCYNSATGGYAMMSYNGVPTLRMNDVNEATTTKFTISSAGGAVTPGTWHHLVAVFDRTGTVTGTAHTVQFYVDNAVQGSAYLDPFLYGEYNISCSNPTYQPLCIGGRNSSAANDFEGYMDDVAIYRGALSATDVRTLYTAANVNATTITTAGITPVAIHNFVANRKQSAAPGVVPDDYGNHTGTFTKPIEQVTDVDRGPVLQLEGQVDVNTESVSYGDVLNPGSESYTVAFWCKLDATTAGQRLASKGYAGSSSKGWSIFLGFPSTSNPDPNAWMLQIRANCTGTSTDRLNVKKTMYATSEFDDEWHHVALVIDQDNNVLKGYMDGLGSGLSGTDNGWMIHSGDPAYTNSFAEGSNFDSPDPLMLGSVNGGYPPNGWFDDFAIWTRALSDGEILGLFNGASFPPRPAIPGDATGDQKVDAADARRLAEYWGATELAPGKTWWEMGDFDDSLSIGAGDASILAANWHYGVVGEGAAVPEPGALIALLSGIVSVGVRPRRGRRE